MPSPALVPPSGVDTTPIQLPRIAAAHRRQAGRFPIFAGAHAHAADFRLVAVDLQGIHPPMKAIRRARLVLSALAMSKIYIAGRADPIPLKGQRYPLSR